MSRAGHRGLLALAAALCLASCAGDPAAKPGTSLSTGGGAAQGDKPTIERLIALGNPAALEEAARLSLDSKTLSRDDAAAYTWIAYEMARLVYPELTSSLPAGMGTPPDTALVRAFIDARNGKAATPGPDAGPLFELFPALTIFRLKTAASGGATLAAAERFSRFGFDSAVADLARGLALERSGDRDGALVAFRRASALDAYPATLGVARVLVDLGRPAEALDALSSLSSPVADMPACRRVRAMALYASGRWAEAEPLITAVLLDDPLDSRFALMRAHLLVERGEYKQAAPLLDAYANVDPSDRLYIVLRAKTALESAKDRSSAVEALRRGLAKYPGDAELSLYAAEVFASGDAKERAESIVIAEKILASDPSSVRALRILLGASLAASDYVTAAARADALLALDPQYADSGSLYRAYRGAGRQADAARLALLWRTREPASEQAALAYATTLVEKGDKAAAAELLAKLLAGKGTATYRSSLYWLQSRIQASEEAALSSLRAALVENGMNVDALASLSDIYVKKADYQRARFYLKQALAIAPDRADIVERRNVLAQYGVAIP